MVCYGLLVEAVTASGGSDEEFVLFLARRKAMAISQELLDILACPKCKGPLKLTAAEDGLDCEACRLRYEIRDDIPIMLIDEAKPLGAV